MPARTAESVLTELIDNADAVAGPVRGMARPRRAGAGPARSRCPPSWPSA